jgi:hypothetical protein
MLPLVVLGLGSGTLSFLLASGEGATWTYTLPQWRNVTGITVKQAGIDPCS